MNTGNLVIGFHLPDRTHATSAQVHSLEDMDKQDAHSDFSLLAPHTAPPAD